MALAKVCLGPGNKCCLMDSGSVEIKAQRPGGGGRRPRPKAGPGEGGLRRRRPAALPRPDQVPGAPGHPGGPGPGRKEPGHGKAGPGILPGRIQAHRLPIYLVQVECLFDASKIIFYFTAPGRVDFRELVKDLVQEFRIRIELRQIGVRHRAKMVGGLGICGRGLCCASLLRDFEPVSVRMAKEQQLSLNPNKISGICGRLMCCLTYEYASYQEIRKHLPRVGKRIQTPEGEGKIIRYNLIRETVTLELEDKRELEVAMNGPHRRRHPGGVQREGLRHMDDSDRSTGRRPKGSDQKRDRRQLLRRPGLPGRRDGTAAPGDRGLPQGIRTAGPPLHGPVPRPGLRGRLPPDHGRPEPEGLAFLRAILRPGRTGSARNCSRAAASGASPPTAASATGSWTFTNCCTRTASCSGKATTRSRPT